MREKYRRLFEKNRFSDARALCYNYCVHLRVRARKIEKEEPL